MKPSIRALALVAASAAAAGAQTPYLVRDIETAADPSPGTEARDLALLDGRLYFVGDDDGSGRDLRRLEPDGTLTLVRDMVAGDATASGSIDEVAAVGGLLYFVLYRTLWKSDGTFEGTVPVRTLEDPPGSLTDVAGTLYFTVSDGDSVLWKSDGTAVGTVPVGPGGYNLEVAGARLFFLRHEAATGNEPWTSDGTAAGTHLLKDVCPGTCSGAHEGSFLTAGSRLYFRGFEPATGQELWTSDGTSAGTGLVADLSPGISGGVGEPLGALDDGALFTTTFPTVALWRTDGTAAGTSMVRPLGVQTMQRSGDVVFLQAFEAATGWELWKTDGTAAGTGLVADICPGTCSFQVRDAWLAAAPFGVVFARGGIADAEVWASDGTAAGTRRVLEGVRVHEYGPPSLPLYFAGEDAANGREVWATDGSPAGTRLVTNRVDSSSLWAYGIGPKQAVGDRMFLTAQRQDIGTELWTTRGSPATTDPLDLTPGIFGSGVYGSAALGDALVFEGIVSDARGVWRSDGSTAGTSLLRPVPAGPEFVTVGGLVFFSASDPGSGFEPWRTDGTAAGTFQLAEIGAAAATSAPKGFTPFQGATFFAATESDGRGLWRTDGTVAGTTQVVSRQCPSVVGATSQHLFLTCFDPATGLELWRSDGTAAGTQLVKDTAPGADHLYLLRGTVAGDALYFTTQPALWRSDGTAAGTAPLRDLLQVPVPLFPDRLVVADGVLYFGGELPGTGLELWRTDGTPAGTFMLRDIVPGPGAGLLPDFYGDTIVAVAGGVVFAAYTPERGLELWRSDGTAAGTVPLPDIAPGPASASPSGLVSVGGTVYARATDGATGYEPWAVPFAGSTVAVADTAVVEGDAGPRDAVFEVRRLSPPATTTVVSYATVSGTAQAGTDFEPRSGLLTFTPGTSALPVAVPLLVDLADEADETFTLALTAAGPVVVADGEGVARIADDDGPRLAAAGTAVAEGDTGTVDATFVLTLSTKDGTPTPESKAAGYATEPGTASAGTDYGAGSGAVTFPAGTASGSSATVTVAVNGDTLDEPDETFALRLVPTGDVAVAPPAAAVVVDDDGVGAAPPRELSHGGVVRADLAPPAGRALDRDYYVFAQQPGASYEVVVDEAAGESAPLTVQRIASDGSTVLQTAAPTGTGSSLSLRWQNTSTTAVSDQHLAVSGASCGSACGPDDGYRLRFYETTLRAPRFNNVGGQGTVVLLQNRSDQPVAGRLHFWRPSGGLAHSHPFVVPARGAAAINTLAILPSSGSLTVAHDGPYGALVGKAVALEPATGFSFDTPLAARPR